MTQLKAMCNTCDAYTEFNRDGRCWRCMFEAAEKRAEDAEEREKLARLLLPRPGHLTTNEDAEACAAWVESLRKHGPDYWTDERIRTLLYAHRQNMTADVEAALRSEWEEACRIVHEGGNAGWTMVVREAVGLLREALAASQALTQRLRTALEKIRNLYATDSLGERNYSKNGNWVAVEIAENALAESPDHVAPARRPHVCTYACAANDCERVVGPAPPEEMDHVAPAPGPVSECDCYCAYHGKAETCGCPCPLHTVVHSPDSEALEAAAQEATASPAPERVCCFCGAGMSHGNFECPNSATILPAPPEEAAPQAQDRESE